jgi:hypothetical protein
MLSGYAPLSLRFPHSLVEDDDHDRERQPCCSGVRPLLMQTLGGGGFLLFFLFLSLVLGCEGQGTNGLAQGNRITMGSLRKPGCF